MIAAQLVAPVHSLRSATAAVSALPEHPMSHLRVIFLVVLVVFFCSLFIGSYLWMRRPNFGQLESGHETPQATRAGVPGAEPPEGMDEGPIRRVP